jgi:hypothetical protein
LLSSTKNQLDHETFLFLKENDINLCIKHPLIYEMKQWLARLVGRQAEKKAEIYTAQCTTKQKISD